MSRREISRMRNWILFLPIALGGAVLPESAGAQVQFTKVVLDTNFVGDQTWDVKAADMDGDADYDILVTTSPPPYVRGALLLYENGGDGSRTRSAIDTATGGLGRIAIADLDGDLDIDVALTAHDSVRWYRNEGGLSFARIGLDRPGAIRFPVIADLDDDADQDILFLSNYGIFWERNNGLQGFGRDTVEATPIVDMGLAVADLDEDSDQDVISSVYLSGPHAVVWYRNDGSESFVRDTIGVTLNTISDLELDDLEGDGDKDLITFEGELNGLLWYRNDGAQEFAPETVGVDVVRAPADLSIGDIDGDGDRDIMVAGGNGTIGEVLYYENDGSEVFTRRTIDGGPGERARIAVADVDGDGDEDILVANNLPSELVLYRNEGPVIGAGGRGGPGRPRGFTFEQNYPNPFNPSTTVRFEIGGGTGTLEASGEGAAQPAVPVVLQVYSLRGELVRTLLDALRAPGVYEVTWDGRDGGGTRMPSGVYFVRLEAGVESAVRKILLVR